MDEDWKKIYESMAGELQGDSFCFDTLFLGKNKSCYSKYSGYLVGYNLVKNKAMTCGLGDLQLMHLPSNDFLI